ncbi:hypothetical protein TWF718_006011 [Orbilia javanica]|uniref:Uncharacterized protein n=1 Tax=Orbilia javanica TaxID=47235 RepID=A0AAN8NXW0_9PEZI
MTASEATNRGTSRAVGLAPDSGRIAHEADQNVATQPDPVPKPGHVQAQIPPNTNIVALTEENLKRVPVDDNYAIKRWLSG